MNNQRNEQIIRNAILGDAQLMRNIMIFSGSDAATNQRVEAYVKSFAATTMLEDLAIKDGASSKYRKVFAAGITEANLQGTTLLDGVLRAQVGSIAGIFCKEVSVDSSEAILQVIDAHNVMDQSVKIPHLGMETGLTDDNFTRDLSSLVDGTLKDFTSANGVIIVPRTLRISVVKPDNTMISIVDDGNGQLLAPAGLLGAGSLINYKTGNIELKFAVAPVLNTKIKIVATQDRPGESSLDSLTGFVKSFTATTSPTIIPVQRNIMAEHLLQRQGVIDTKSYYTNLVETTYQKKVNIKVVKALVSGLSGDVYTGDLSAFDIGNSSYNTFVRTFKSILADGQSQLAHQTYTGAKVTGILAGKAVANLFNYMNSNEGWIENTAIGYFKDVIGWYNEIPVVRWEGDGLADDELILSHKTPGGELAAVLRPIFLTPTDIAEVFNFDNPLQVKSGMYAVDGANATSSKLTLKIKITLPEQQFLTKN